MLDAGAQAHELALIAVAVVEAAAIALLARALLRRRAADAVASRAHARVAQLGRAGATAELAGWFGSELGTPLASMLNNLGAARRFLGRPEPALADAVAAVDEALFAGERAAQVMGRVRSIVPVESAPQDAIDVNDVVRGAIRLVQEARLAQGVSIAAELADALPRVQGDAGLLLQAALSLLLNAVEAASASRLRRVAVRTLAGDGSVQLLVTDSGAGVSERDRPHLFAPFFTTRRGGLGLGLAMARSIAEAHGGILVAERPVSGAAFRVTLPAVAAASSTLAAPPLEPPVRTA